MDVDPSFHGREEFSFLEEVVPHTAHEAVFELVEARLAGPPYDHAGILEHTDDSRYPLRFPRAPLPERRQEGAEREEVAYERVAAQLSWRRKQHADEERRHHHAVGGHQL